jgi:hypothetical protein
MFYLHPWEVDPGQPRFQVSTTTRIRHYTGLKSTLPRFARLLEQFQFEPVAAMLERAGALHPPVVGEPVPALAGA